MQIIREFKMCRKEVGIICIIGYIVSFFLCTSFGDLVDKQTIFVELGVPLIITFICSKYINLQTDLLKDILKASAKSYLKVFIIRYFVIILVCLMIETIFLIMLNEYFVESVLCNVFVSACTSIYLSTIGILFSSMFNTEYIGAIVAALFSIISLVTKALVEYTIFRFIYPFPILNGMSKHQFIIVEVTHLICSIIIWIFLYEKYKDQVFQKMHMK